MMDETSVSRVRALFCEALKTDPADVLRIYENPGRGISNDTYVIETIGGSYLLRIPGRGTDLFCNRAYECEVYARLAGTGLTDSVPYFDPESGVKISVYIPNAHVARTNCESDLQRAMALLRRFHEQKLRFGPANTAPDRLLYYMQCVEKVGGEAFYPDGFDAMRRAVERLRPVLYGDESAFQLVHGDGLPHNYLFPPEGDPILIDWEFASVSMPWEDLGDFCHDGDLAPDECVHLLALYLGRAPTQEEQARLFGYCAAAAGMWCAWSVFKIAMEPTRREFYTDYAALGLRYANDSLAEMRRREGWTSC